MNTQETIAQIMREKGVTRQWMAEKMGHKHASAITEKLRNPNGFRTDFLVQMLELMNCELVVRSRTKEHREWVISTSSKDE